MTDFSRSIEIAAPPARVYAVMIDVERWAEWTASIRSIERLDKGPFVVGSRAKVRQPKLLPALFEVTELEDGKGFTWITRSPGLWVAGGHWVVPAGRGSVATLSLKFRGVLGPLVATVMRSLNERYLGLEAEGLKRRSESAEGATHG
jgi:uncharacterized protein YndB with AHSA1/START domain